MGKVTFFSRNHMKASMGASTVTVKTAEHKCAKFILPSMLSILVKGMVATQSKTMTTVAIPTNTSSMRCVMESAFSA